MNTGSVEKVGALPNSITMNGDEFTRVTTKTTPRQFVDDRFDNDAFAGNDNNRRLAGKRILEKIKAQGEGVSTQDASEIARNGAPEDSVVHKSNFEAAKIAARTDSAVAPSAASALPEGGEGVTNAPATDPAIKDGKAKPEANADAAAGWKAQS